MAHAGLESHPSVLPLDEESDQDEVRILDAAADEVPFQHHIWTAGMQVGLAGCLVFGFLVLWSLYSFGRSVHKGVYVERW